MIGLIALTCAGATGQAQTAVNTHLGPGELGAQSPPDPSVERWIDPEIFYKGHSVLHEVIAALPETDVYREHVIVFWRSYWGITPVPVTYINRQGLDDLYMAGNFPKYLYTDAALAFRKKLETSAKASHPDAVPLVPDETILITPDSFTPERDDGTGLKVVLSSESVGNEQSSSRKSVGSASALITLPEVQDLRLYSLGRLSSGRTNYIDYPYILFSLLADGAGTAYRWNADGSVTSLEPAEAQMGVMLQSSGDYHLWSTTMTASLPEKIANPASLAAEFPGNYPPGSQIVVEVFVLNGIFLETQKLNGEIVRGEPGAPPDTAPWAWVCLHTRLAGSGLFPLTICARLPNVDPEGHYNRIEFSAGLGQQGGSSAPKWSYAKVYQNGIETSNSVFGTGSYMTDLGIFDLGIGPVVRSAKASVSPEIHSDRAVVIPKGAYISDITTPWRLNDSPTTKFKVDFCNSTWHNRGGTFSEKCQFGEQNLRFWQSYFDTWVAAIKTANDGSLKGFYLSNEDLQRLYDACEFTSIVDAITTTDEGAETNFGRVMYGAQYLKNDPEYSFCAGTYSP